MGFYDNRCMITGVSLKGIETVLIPLQQSTDTYVPITLALKGDSDRYGAIDGIEEDVNTGLIFEFFCDKLQNGEFVVEQEYLRSSGHYPFLTIADLISAFERNINDSPTAAVLNGKPVVFALICRAVWEAIAHEMPLPDASVSDILPLVFKDFPLASGIYGGKLAEVSEHLRELYAVHNFLHSRSLIWHPDEEPSQHYAEEMREFLKEARQAFSDSYVVLEALAAYDEEAADLLSPE